MQTQKKITGQNGRFHPNVDNKTAVQLLNWHCSCGVCPYLLGTHDMTSRLDAGTICIKLQGVHPVFTKKTCATFVALKGDELKSIHPLLFEKASQSGIQLPKEAIAA